MVVQQQKLAYHYQMKLSLLSKQQPQHKEYYLDPIYIGWGLFFYIFLGMKGEKNMLRKEITYKDYNGTDRTETFYFNLNQAELMEMEMSTSGGYTEMVKSIVAAQDTPSIIKIFKDLILKAYGEKSPDGKRFMKSDELSTAFSQTEAYSELFMELATDAEKAAEFVNGIIPAEIAAEAAKQGITSVTN